jgi:multidrug efflux system outer membrane protein
LDFFGAKSTQEEGQASIEVQKEALNAARLDLIYSMTSAYLTALGLNQEIAIAQKSLSVQKETLGITQAKVEAGSASTLDSTSASASVALTAADIPALQQSREESIHQIALLLGKEPSALQGVFGKYKPLPRPKVKFSEGIPADLIRNRPDIREAERQLQVAAAEIGISKAALYPTLSLSGTYTSTTIGANSATNIWSLGPSITLPIFDRGRLYKAVDLSRSEARQQYLTYRQTVIAAVGAVEDALVALRSERIRHARLSEAVAEYTKAESLARQLYSSGSSGFTDVLTAQASLYSAQKQLAVSSLTLSVDYATLCYALGGGWAGNEPVMTER